ncbi:similar to UPSTREAM OF FLC protein [Actinidia rufa]|uniref:Similar to UPSTREAM OF FLC protein n=1 Tax=Actinidia rufa TaxID=165716 RepID=A0A7J0DVD8_9ERIC|nr:similar to UPSTREAM OF FLC protein [Actinidia rufa]
MEVTHLPHQHLTLKDVMERLTVLRGKGMPSLYSWSCKRSYKNGYVWNDLAENDIIYPSEGADSAEYVLKGSELIEGCTEKFQQLQVSNRPQQVPGPIFHLKRKPLGTKRHCEPQETDKTTYEDENEEDEDKTSYTGSMTPQYSHCSRGVCTDDIELTQNHPTTELTLDNDSSPPSTTSSDKASDSNTASKRFCKQNFLLLSDSTLNPYLLILSVRVRRRRPSGTRVTAESRKLSAASTYFLRRLSVVQGEDSATATPSTAARKSGASLHKGVLCKTAATAVTAEEVGMIGCMSENPRFGNLQGEEREYFSGSIVEAMGEEGKRVGPRLKRSSSFNEERSSKAEELSEAVAEETKREKAVMKGKCIPRMKSSKQSKK